MRETKPSLDPEIAAAQKEWEHLADRLRACEQMLVATVAEHTKDGKPVPLQMFNDVKAAREKCSAAFHHLMDLIERRMSR